MNSAKKIPSPNYKIIYALRWSVFTPFYDLLLFLSGLGRKFTTKIVNEAEIKTHEKKVVDVGCGTGLLLEILKKLHPAIELIGVDPDGETLTLSSKRLQRLSLSATLRQSYAEKLPFTDGSVDMCFSVLTFHHMPTHIKQEVMCEIYRILRPGGRFILTDWGKPRVKSLRWLLLFEKQEYLDCHFNGLVPTYLQKAGFIILEEKKVKPTGIYTWIAQK